MAIWKPMKRQLGTRPTMIKLPSRTRKLLSGKLPPDMIPWRPSSKLIMMLSSFCGKKLSSKHAMLMLIQSTVQSLRHSRTKKKKEESLTNSTHRLVTKERSWRMLKPPRRRRRRQLSSQQLLMQKKELKVAFALPKRNVQVRNIAVELASVRMVTRNSSLKESAWIAPPWDTRDSSLNILVLAVPSQCSHLPLPSSLLFPSCDSRITNQILLLRYYKRWT